MKNKIEHTKDAVTRWLIPDQLFIQDTPRTFTIDDKVYASWTKRKHNKLKIKYNMTNLEWLKKLQGELSIDTVIKKENNKVALVKVFS